MRQQIFHFSLFTFTFIYRWISIHGKDTFTKESLILVVESNLGYLPSHIGLEALLVCLCVVSGIGRITMKFVKSNIVAREQLVIPMDLLVHPFGHRLVILGLRQVRRARCRQVQQPDRRHGPYSRRCPSSYCRGHPVLTS